MNAPAHPTMERLWAIAGGVSVRTKILGMALLLVLALGTASILQTRVAMSRTLEAQLSEQSVSMARDVAARSADLILINDLYGLQTLLRETRENNSSVRYAFVVNAQGEVLAHTFGEGFPAGLKQANAVAADAHHQTRAIDTEDGRVLDTAAPVFEGRAGTARVGLSEAGVRLAVDELTAQLAITTLAISIFGVTAAAGLTWLVTQPILRLGRAAQAVGRGDFSQRLTRWADDEIGDLSEAFNGMMADLSRAAEERASREQLREQYVQQVITAQEDERKRIARELHDSTSQSLTSLMIGLRSMTAACDSPEVTRHADELRQVAARTLDEVHSLARQLRPSVLDDLGLSAAIERYVDDCRARYGLQIDLALRGLEARRLPPNIETALYRITQESLTNVARHAGARTASILIERRNGTVRAVVEDDGQGFEPSQIGDGHFGLYGIRERAELLGGTLTIESSPGAGASLFVEIPVREAARDAPPSPHE